MELNDNRPAVFLSSTIHDFGDLRSALGFYLEKSGYRVYMSETTTFPVNPNQSNFNQCFDLIDKCQYYILLVGDKKGSWYKQDETSITQEEFRYARQRFEQTGDISLLTFVRENVWSAVGEYKRSDRKHPSSIKDIDFISDFIDEITRDSEYLEAQQTGSPYPKGTWVSRFSRFQDIIDVLSISMRVDTNRKMEILRGLALDELLENIRACFDDYTASGEAIPVFAWLQPVIEARTTKGIRVPAAQARDLATIGLFGLSTSTFKTSALKELLLSGELLDYDVHTKRFKKSRVMQLIEVLIAEIERVQGFFISNSSYGSWGPELDRFSKDAARLSPETEIEIPENLFVVLWMLGRTQQICNSASVLYQVLRSPELDYSEFLGSLGDGFYHIKTVSGKTVGPVSFEKVQEWFSKQGYPGYLE